MIGVCQLQRTDLLGLEYYNLKSLNFDLGKWFSYNTNLLKVSFGTNFFDGVAFKVPIDQKKYFDGKFNYVAVTVLRPFMFFDIGIGLNSVQKFHSFIAHKKILIDEKKSIDFRINRIYWYQHTKNSYAPRR